MTGIQVKTSDSVTISLKRVFKLAIQSKVNLEGWWHPRRHIRNAEGEEYE